TRRRQPTDVPIQIKPVQALYLQSDVAIHEFRNARHARDFTESRGPPLVGLRSKTSLAPTPTALRSRGDQLIQRSFNANGMQLENLEIHDSSVKIEDDGKLMVGVHLMEPETACLIGSVFLLNTSRISVYRPRQL